MPSGLITGAGRDQAHDLLIELVLALVSEDEARLGTLIAERVLSAAPHADGTPPHTGMDRSALVRHMLAAVRAARLPEAPHVSSLLESAIEIEPASSVYPSDLVPTGVAPTDLVVRFRVRPEGRRALAGLAPSGSGLLVVRPGPSPQLIAR